MMIAKWIKKRYLFYFISSCLFNFWTFLLIFNGKSEWCIKYDSTRQTYNRHWIWYCSIFLALFFLVYLLGLILSLEMKNASFLYLYFGLIYWMISMMGWIKYLKLSWFFVVFNYVWYLCFFFFSLFSEDACFYVIFIVMFVL